MIRPMPSPRGTNIEKLYILRGRGAPTNPAAAYDSAYNSGPHTAAQGAAYGAALAKRLIANPNRRLAFDEVLPDTPGGAGNSDAVAQIVAWALGNLTPADLDELVAAIGRERNMSLDRRRPAMDTGRPSRVETSASARDSFYARYPDAARIKTY
ncbi:MAG: hypothetical protein WBO09_02765 [Methylocystis silviterrae]|uniref:hypothetical protein n=1 Tax=Methylocystis silviterrae TaxID=2743612 RepID=UPI003C77F27A